MTGAAAGAAAGAAGGGGIGKVNIDPNGLMGGKANFAGSQMNVGSGLTNTPGNMGTGGAGAGLGNNGNGGNGDNGDNGGGNGDNSQQMVNIETPGDTMNTVSRSFKQYVTNAKAKAQALMSDPGLKQITQPQAVQTEPVQQQAPVQEKKKEEEKPQMQFDDFMKMVEYVKAAKQQSDLKKQESANKADTPPTTM